MRRYFICLAATILTACASNPIQKMSLKDAVNFGTAQYSNTPNYAFKSSVRLDSIQLGIADKDGFNAVLNRLFKRMSFDMNGVVDTPNKQYQIIPSYQYKAKNLQMALSFPMVYDGNQQHFLVDVSALDALLGNGDNEGKYSRFDVSQFDINDKGEKILRIIQKYTRSNYDKMQDSAFVELPLNHDDKRMNIVRKIQINANLKNDTFDTTGMIKEVVALIKPADNTSDALIETLAQSEAKSKELIAPNSTQTSVLSFDKEGRIVQAQSSIDMGIKSPPSALANSSGMMQMRANNTKEHAAQAESNLVTDENPVSTRMTATATLSMGDIGHAKILNPPSADNTVDGIENFKSGFLGRTLTDIFEPKNTEETPVIPSAK